MANKVLADLERAKADLGEKPASEDPSEVVAGGGLLVAMVLPWLGLASPSSLPKVRQPPWGKAHDFHMLYVNPTVFGQKAMRVLAGIEPEDKPDAIAFVEVHLRGGRTE